jgi:hypothetical protein
VTSGSRCERAGTSNGFVAVELTAAIALLLVPTLLLVATLPTWFERRHAAVVAAREAALIAAETWPDDGRAAAEDAARLVARDHGIGDAEVHVSVRSPIERGDAGIATVTVEMPVVSALGVRLGGFAWTVESERWVDDHRSRS